MQTKTRNAADRRRQGRRSRVSPGVLMAMVGVLQQVRVSLLHQGLASDVLRAWNEANDTALAEVVADLTGLAMELAADGKGQEGGARNG